MRGKTRSKLEGLYIDWIGVEQTSDLEEIASEDMLVDLIVDLYDMVEIKADGNHTHTLT